MDFGIRVEIVPAEPEIRDQRRRPDPVPAEGRVVAGHVQRIAAREKGAEIRRSRKRWRASAKLLLSAPAREQVVLVAQVVVPADVPLAEILVARRLKRVVSYQVVVQRVGIEVLGGPRDRIEPRRWNDLVRERLPSVRDGPVRIERIVDRVRDLRKIALAHQRRRNRSHEGRRLADIGQLEVAEEERLVPLDGPAHGETVLLAAELRLLAGREVGLGVHALVAHEVETRAVDIVRAGLDGQRNDPGRRLPVFRGEAVRDHLELGYGVDRRLDRFLLRALRGDRLVVVVHAVDHEVDLGPALAADRNALPARHDRAGGNHRQLQIVPPVERKVDDLAVLDHGAGRTLRGLQERRGCLDLDDFRHRADFERDVQLANVADRERDAGTRVRLESFRFDDHDVRADPQRIRTVAAGVVRLRRRSDTGLNVVERYVDSRNHRSGRVRNGSHDQGRVGLLRDGERRHGQQQDERDGQTMKSLHEFALSSNRSWITAKTLTQRT